MYNIQWIYNTVRMEYTMYTIRWCWVLKLYVDSSLYSVQCVKFTYVHLIVYGEHCTVYTEYIIQWITYHLVCVLLVVQWYYSNRVAKCTMFNVQCTLYMPHCTCHIVHCIRNNIHSAFTLTTQLIAYNTI